MTREAIEYFKFYREIFCEDRLKFCPKDSIAYQATLKEKEFYDMAIKALAQEPILDKIRAEIVELTRCPYGTECLGANCPSNTDCMICGDHVIEIIDEYLKKVETKACINCDYFSDREFYTDNTVTACAVSFGSCTKCQRNITSTSPHTEVPSWCPLKGDKDEFRN